MTSATIEIPTPDGSADAYVARPDGAVRPPAVLFLIDAFGLRKQIEDMADRIADRGYLVLAPNLFYRSGRAPLLDMPDLTDPDKRAEFFGRLKPLIDALTPERVVGDGKAYLDFLEQEAPGPVAISGYCMGARIGWRIATAYPDRVRALAGFHGGGLVTDADDSPHRSASQLSAELYFGFADNDQSMNPEMIAELERTLDDVGARYRSEVYAGAAHGYTMADTAAFNEAARERHFSALFDLLKTAL